MSGVTRFLLFTYRGIIGGQVRCCPHTAALTRLNGCSPLNILAISSHAMTCMRSTLAAVNDPICGVQMVLGKLKRGWLACGGSGSKTSSPAPARCPERSAASKASVSTRAPRATLIR